jgi:hypothetical protein
VTLAGWIAAHLPAPADANGASAPVAEEAAADLEPPTYTSVLIERVAPSEPESALGSRGGSPSRSGSEGPTRSRSPARLGVQGAVGQRPTIFGPRPVASASSGQKNARTGQSKRAAERGRKQGRS